MLRTEVIKHVFVITLNRPDRLNAINKEMSDNLNEAWREFRSNPELWVAVIKGSGGNFSSGMDLQFLSSWREQNNLWEKYEHSSIHPDFTGITRNLDVWKPKIAAIEGYCLGGGLELALACDIRLATGSAKLGFPEVKWGIIPGGGGTQRLPRIIPPGIALELIITGRIIESEECYRIGLINKIVTEEEIYKSALKVAEDISKNGPLAVRAATQAVRNGLEMTLEQGLRLESLLKEIIQTTEDAGEGLRAFMEERPPAFKAK